VPTSGIASMESLVVKIETVHLGSTLDRQDEYLLA
jgi:hypothetical protein